MKIGDKIRDIRTLKGFSQENMADILNISKKTYGDIERNQIKELTLARLEQIAEALEVSLNDILSFGERIANFFEQSSGANVLNGVVHNNYDTKETQHQLEKAQLEIEKLKLEIENARLENEKLKLEVKYLKEKYEKN
jgi:transcriptional regulator with XRE-family HTH domain